MSEINKRSGKPLYFETVSFDFDAVWAALSKSAGLDRYITDLARKVESEARAKAESQAKDDGYYAAGWDYDAVSANQIRRLFKGTWQQRSVRRKRGQEGTNRLIDRPGTTSKQTIGNRTFTKRHEIEGDIDGSEYIGTIGVVFNTDFKAHWIEFGSLANRPLFILNRSAEETAARTGNTYERLYQKSYQPDRAELNKRISTGSKKVNEAKRQSNAIERGREDRYL
jgi:hypothetical protein